ncbi:MAG: LLM class flavin-dependent oxidoreductase [Candidatus Bathyarchaeia archaeon]
MGRVEFSISLNVNEALKETAVKGLEAERGELDQVWVGDHPDQRYPAIAAGLIAENTRRIRIGLGPLSPFLHPAQHISGMFKTLVEAYGPRFDLCLVPGDRLKLGSVGVTYEGGLQNGMLDALKIMREGLSNQGIETCIWLGAQGPETLRISVGFDGVLLNLSDPEMIRVMIDGSSLRRYMEHSDFKVGIFFPSYIHRFYDPEIQRSAEEAALQVILGASKAILKSYELEGLVKDMGEASPRGIPREVLRKFHVSMPVHRLSEYIDTVSDMGVSHFAFAFPQNSRIDLIRDLAYAVKLIRGRG